MELEKESRINRIKKSYFGILSSWGHVCIVCGEPITNLESLTREHLITRSMMLKLGAKNTTRDNLAPSHHRCNCLRGDMRLSEAMDILDRIKRSMDRHEFMEWVNQPVPNRWPKKNN